MTERKRLIPDRFRRIWHIAEHVAAEPGHTRRELADTFHLSERQVQADLNIIRTDMRLPIIRRQGYRFVGEGPTSGAGCFDLREAQLLVLILGLANKDSRVPKQRLESLMAKLPSVFPPHLQPLAGRTLEAIVRPASNRQGQVFAALADGLLRGSWAKLHYPPHDYANMPSGGPELIVRPELLIPYLSSWYVIGQEQLGGRTRMLNLDAVTAVTLTADLPVRSGR